MGQQGDGQENQEGLIGLEIIGDADPGRLFKDIEAADEEQRGTKVHGEGDGDIAGDVGPATDPGCDATAPERREDECLIVSGNITSMVSEKSTNKVEV